MNWRNIPFVLALLALWVGIKLAGYNTSFVGPVGITLICVTFFVLFIEFFKSGDIGLKTFGLDTAFSVLQVIACTATVTYLITRSSWGVMSIPDLLVCFTVLVDAWFSPYNSFRTALRNFAATTTAPSPQPGETD